MAKIGKNFIITGIFFISLNPLLWIISETALVSKVLYLSPPTRCSTDAHSRNSSIGAANLFLVQSNWIKRRF